MPSRTQGYIEWRHDKLRLPIVGIFDYEWDKHGIIADLKGRSGLRQAFEGCDEGIQAEIRDAWMLIARRIIEKS